jgi:hypothetical protein
MRRDDIYPRIGDAVDREMPKDDDTVREYDVARCSYAEFLKALGELELGDGLRMKCRLRREQPG